MKRHETLWLTEHLAQIGSANQVQAGRFGILFQTNQLEIATVFLVETINHGLQDSFARSTKIVRKFKINRGNWRSIRLLGRRLCSLGRMNGKCRRQSDDGKQRAETIRHANS